MNIPIKRVNFPSHDGKHARRFHGVVIKPTKNQIHCALCQCLFLSCHLELTCEFFGADRASTFQISFDEYLMLLGHVRVRLVRVNSCAQGQLGKAKQTKRVGFLEKTLQPCRPDII